MTTFAVNSLTDSSDRARGRSTASEDRKRCGRVTIHLRTTRLRQRDAPVAYVCSCGGISTKDMTDSCICQI